MFTGKKPSREQLFEKAVLSRKERIVRRRPSQAEMFRFPWVSLLLWLAFSSVGGYILLFSPALMIREVSVEGESILPIVEYQTVAESVMRGSFFGVLQHRNFFLVPTDRIAAAILDRYPQITDVSLKRHFPNGLSLSLTESPSILRWCSGGPCYGIRNGRAVSLPFAEEDRYDLIRLSVTDQSALPVILGAELPVDSYLSAFQVVRENFSKLDAGTILLVARTPSRYSGELTLTTEEGWEFVLSVERPAEESLGTLRAFLTEYAKEHKDRTNLASVDLRVEGKIFYAEKISSSETEDSSIDVSVPEKDAEKKKKKSGQ